MKFFVVFASCLVLAAARPDVSGYAYPKPPANFNQANYHAEAPAFTGSSSNLNPVGSYIPPKPQGGGYSQGATFGGQGPAQVQKTTTTTVTGSGGSGGFGGNTGFSGGQGGGNLGGGVGGGHGGQGFGGGQKQVSQTTFTSGGNLGGGQGGFGGSGQGGFSGSGQGGFGGSGQSGFGGGQKQVTQTTFTSGGGQGGHGGGGHGGGGQGAGGLGGFGATGGGSGGFGSASGFGVSGAGGAGLSGQRFGSGHTKYTDIHTEYITEKPIVTKHFYVHAAPEDEEIHARQTIRVPAPQKHYKIIFIKTPNAPALNPAALPPAVQNEEKTIVYVLSKRPEDYNAELIVPTPPPTPPAKPEVYFIKYKGKDEHKTIQHIQNQYADGHGAGAGHGGAGHGAGHGGVIAGRKEYTTGSITSGTVGGGHGGHGGHKGGKHTELRFGGDGGSGEGSAEFSSVTRTVTNSGPSVGFVGGAAPGGSYSTGTGGSGFVTKTTKTVSSGPSSFEHHSSGPATFVTGGEHYESFNPASSNIVAY